MKTGVYGDLNYMGCVEQKSAFKHAQNARGWGGGGWGGGGGGGGEDNSCFWHSMDVRAEWPSFSALPSI